MDCEAVSGRDFYLVNVLDVEELVEKPSPQLGIPPSLEAALHLPTVPSLNRYVSFYRIGTVPYLIREKCVSV